MSGLLLLAHGDGAEVPPFSPATLFTQTDLLQVTTLLVLATAALYGYGVWRLAKAGHRWPVGRSVAFGVGLAFIAIATVSGLAAYDDVLLSAHMVQHMLLAMVGPIFLALGAPITLALRTLPADGRRVLLSLLHSRVAKFFTFPLVSFALFIASPFVLYFSGLYQLSLENDWVHDLVHLHFLIVGCLFLWPLIGLDPVPGRMSYPLRALVMFLSTPFHTVLGLTVMQSSSLIAGSYYVALHLPWSDPYSDQKVAGGILWAGGEIVSVAMLAALVVQWMRQADREARRIDRALDRQEALERAAARAAAGVPVDDAHDAADLTALAAEEEGVEDELTLGTIDAQVSPEHRRNIR